MLFLGFLMLQLCLYLHELQFHRCTHLLYNNFSLNFFIQYRYLYVSQRVCQIKSVLDWNLWVCPYPPLKKEPDSAQLCSFCKYLNSDFVIACRGTCELWRSHDEDNATKAYLTEEQSKCLLCAFSSHV